MITFENAIAEKASFTLKGAILVYDNGTECISTCHDVSVIDDFPVIRPGKAVTPQNLKKCVRFLLDQKVHSFFIPPNVLSYTDDTICWYCKPSIRKLYFKVRSGNLDDCSGKEFPQPGLVFMYGVNDLNVWAVRCNGRPDEKTKLYHAPYYNISEDGDVCMGSVRLPNKINVDSIDKVEKLFFSSAATHSNNIKIVDYPGGHDAFWRANAGKLKFDKKVLVPNGKTLKEIL